MNPLQNKKKAIEIAIVCELGNLILNQMFLALQVKSTQSCKPVTSRSCVNITWQDCHDEPRQNKSHVAIWKPYQVWLVKNYKYITIQGLQGMNS